MEVPVVADAPATCMKGSEKTSQSVPVETFHLRTVVSGRETALIGRVGWTGSQFVAFSQLSRFPTSTQDPLVICCKMAILTGAWHPLRSFTTSETILVVRIAAGIKPAFFNRRAVCRAQGDWMPFSPTRETEDCCAIRLEPWVGRVLKQFGIWNGSPYCE